MMGECKPYTAKRLYKAHRNNHFLRAWNRKGNGAIDMPEQSRDWTGPETFGLWLRIRKPWWARLVLWACDLETLFGTIHWRTLRKDRVSRNHMLVNIVARKVMPTLVSRLSFWLNDWDDLIERWHGHCIDVKEYPTYHLFETEIRRMKAA